MRNTLIGLADNVRRSVDDSANAGDAINSDLFTATSAFLDQCVWFLESHLDHSAA